VVLRFIGRIIEVRDAPHAKSPQWENKYPHPDCKSPGGAAHFPYMRRRHILPIRSRLVLFDGGCGLCTSAVTFLLRVDVLRRLRFADIDTDWSWLSKDYPQLDHDACLADMHVVIGDGRVHSGFDAYRSIAWVTPAGWPFLPFLYVPGVPWIGRRIYRYVAANRSTTTCAIH